LTFEEPKGGRGLHRPPLRLDSDAETHLPDGDGLH